MSYNWEMKRSNNNWGVGPCSQFDSIKQNTWEFNMIRSIFDQHMYMICCFIIRVREVVVV